MKEPKHPPLELPLRLEPTWDDDDPPLDFLPPGFVVIEKPEDVPTHVSELGGGYTRAWKDADQLRRTEPDLLVELRAEVLDDVAAMLLRKNAWRSWHDQRAAERNVGLAKSTQEHTAAMDAYWRLVDHTWSMAELEDAARRYCLTRGFQRVFPNSSDVVDFSRDLLAATKAIRRLSARAIRLFPYHDVDNELDRACCEHLDPLAAQLSAASTGQRQGKGRPRQPNEESFIRFWYSECVRRTGAAQDEAGMTLFNGFFRDPRFLGSGAQLTDVASYKKRVNEIIQPPKKRRAPRREIRKRS